ncbi:DoxX family protein [Spirosoma arcticum]
MNLLVSPQTRTPSKARLIGYWIITALITFELVYGALWDFDLLNKGYVDTILRHLGYPLYLGAILGACKLAAAVVIFMPGLLLMKEWAYAGVVILFTGGFVSHLLVGDGPGQFIWSLLFGVLAIGSWSLRPENRRIVMKAT